MFKSILVLESAWDSREIESKSVWPIVKEFANASGIKAYHQTFTDKLSLLHWIDIYNKKNPSQKNLLYIASHGVNGRISGLKRDINIKTVISHLQRKQHIQYVHFGCCLVGNPQNLTKLLNKAKYITMASGYYKSVDWVDSTMLDIMLWGRIISREYNKRSNEYNKGQKSHNVVKEFVRNEIPGLADKLGFQLVYRYGKRPPFVWPE